MTPCACNRHEDRKERVRRGEFISMRDCDTYECAMCHWERSRSLARSLTRCQMENDIIFYFDCTQFIMIIACAVADVLDAADAAETDACWHGWKWFGNIRKHDTCDSVGRIIYALLCNVYYPLSHSLTHSLQCHIYIRYLRWQPTHATFFRLIHLEENVWCCSLSHTPDTLVWHYYTRLLHIKHREHTHACTHMHAKTK